MSDNEDAGDRRQSFLRRWSQRKLEQRQIQSDGDAHPAHVPRCATPGATAEGGDAAPLPPIEELHANSEVSMFLGEGVSEMLKRQALRKLFHMDKFNVVDGLDDYAEDYTAFQPLGKITTAHRRLREERERLKQALAEEERTASRPDHEALDASEPPAAAQGRDDDETPTAVAVQDAAAPGVDDDVHEG